MDVLTQDLIKEAQRGEIQCFLIYMYGSKLFSVFLLMMRVILMHSSGKSLLEKMYNIV
jgi:hypothetical protein